VRKSLVLAGAVLIGMVLGSTMLSRPVANAANALLNVVVTNDDGDPIPVRNGGTPLTVELRFFGGEFTYTVPDGKRFVIQYINGTFIGADPTFDNSITLGHGVSGSTKPPTAYSFLGERQSLSVGDELYVSEVVLIDAGPGDTLGLHNSPQDIISVRLNGHLIDE